MFGEVCALHTQVRPAEGYDPAASVASLRRTIAALQQQAYSLASEVHDRMRIEQALREVNFDRLTGLPNRSVFHDRLEMDIKKAHRSRLPLALLFIDLDHFKEINDTLGHDTGDQLLQQVGQRLSAYVRETDTVARIGGDEFTITLGELQDLNTVTHVAQKILGDLTGPFQLGNKVAYISASIGITLYPQDAASAGELLRNADQAMYWSKDIGRNRFTYFTRSMQEAAQARMAGIELEIEQALLPKDPNDERNTFLEIRAGTGGDESALFAGELFRMYMRFAERNRWQVEIMSESHSEIGGYKEVIARIIGRGAYSRLKFESGGHRVQRVPETETQGRIHTSACTVAVMPEADEIGEVVINPSELKIDTYRASGAGGQHINKTDSAVRITHLPTGIVVECQDDRSQHKNKARAMAVLAARIKDAQTREQQSKEAATRKSLVGSGDRSERIRTYNFPQGRVTDHRINLTLYKIDSIMDGDLAELTGALASEHQAEQLAVLSQGG